MKYVSLKVKINDQRRKYTSDDINSFAYSTILSRMGLSHAAFRNSRDGMGRILSPSSAASLPSFFTQIYTSDFTGTGPRRPIVQGGLQKGKGI